MISIRTDDRTLGSLLEYRDFLEKILQHLIEDGLHDCRLVCHRWKDVCNTLGVKLCEVPVKRLTDALNVFPNTTSLSIEMNETVDCGGVMRQLTAFRKLKDLALERREVWSSTKSLTSYFRTLEQLQTLTIAISPVDVGVWFSSALRHLTRLTSLEVEVMGWEDMEISPFTELRNIEKLNLTSNMLINSSHELLFPSLSNLTELSVTDGNGFESVSDLELLQVVQRYGSTLLQVTLYVDADDSLACDWTVLQSFVKLEGLFIPEAEAECTNLYRVLTEMSQLKELDVGMVNLDYEGEMESVFSMRGLKSLAFDVHSTCESNHSRLEPLSELTQLTRLSIENLPLVEPIRKLTQLVHLNLVMSNEVGVDAAELFLHLPLLEELSVSPLQDSAILRKSLCRLRNLHTLDLCLSSDAGVELFEALAGLSNLRCLCFSCEVKKSCASTLSHINLLPKLQHLIIDFVTDCSPCEYLSEGNLSRLRSVSFMCPDFSEEDERELRRRFPSLNSINNDSFT